MSTSSDDSPDARSDAGTRRLLDAVVAVAADLDLDTVLHTIVDAAVRLAGARYAALGVVGPDRRLARFLHVGIDAETAAGIGPLPAGRGILGLLVDEPRPLRLPDLGAHERSYGFPAGHPPMRSFLGVPVRVRGDVYGNLYLTEKVGAPQFTQADEDVVVALAAAAGVAIQNARLYEDGRRRQRWLAASGALQAALLGGDGEGTDVVGPSGAATAELLVAQGARQGSGAAVAAVLRRVDGRVGVGGGDLVEVVAAAGEGGDRLLGRVLPAAPTAEDLLAAAGVRPAAARAGEDRHGPYGGESGTGEPGEPPGEPLTVVLPGGRRSAVLLLSGGEPLDETGRRLLEEYARTAALALDYAAVQGEHRRLAVYEDRDRIARDLHDLVIQRLFATGLSLQGAERAAGRLPGGEPVRDRLSAAVDELDATISDIRRTIFELQAEEEAQEASLRTRVLALCRTITPALGAAPRVVLAGPLDSAVPEAVVGHLLAVLREALANVARHAQATAVDVEVTAEGGRVRLVVGDDGVGFAQAEGRRSSGLGNLTRRAEALGGEAEVTSERGVGTTVRWEVPVTAP